MRACPTQQWALVLVQSMYTRARAGWVMVTMVMSAHTPAHNRHAHTHTTHKPISTSTPLPAPGELVVIRIALERLGVLCDCAWVICVLEKLVAPLLGLGCERGVDVLSLLDLRELFLSSLCMRV
jgi:hypothetical protein